MSTGPKNTLLLIPTLPVIETSSGRLVLTDKFVEGVEAFVASWPGDVEVLFRPQEHATDNLDNREYDPAELPFEIYIAPYDSPLVAERMAAASITLGGLANEQTHLAELAAEVGTPFVYTSEYTLKTRQQIARVEEANVLRRYRRMFWEWNLERRQLKSVQCAAGIQCNGTPTYDEYHEQVQNSLLFFDTRLSKDKLIRPDALEARMADMGKGRPLRLAFSGRLKEMKGVDHLVPFAVALRALDVDFTLEIFGDGVLRDAIARDIAKHDIGDRVTLPGNLDFVSELLPRVQSTVDLFIACHRQGDPSCTYLETFGCGVPIAGYANEAFAGLLDRSVAGIKVPMDDLQALAEDTAELAVEPERLKRLSRAALRFASLNTCEITFERRTEHLLELARKRRTASA